MHRHQGAQRRNEVFGSRRRIVIRAAAIAQLLDRPLSGISNLLPRNRLKRSDHGSTENTVSWSLVEPLLRELLLNTSARLE